jgi:hypothetical protein
MGQDTKMLWDCARQGCFNVKKRLKFWAFKEALPGRIAFSDVDGVVEIGGQFLFLEWKGNGAPLPLGQRIMFERLSSLPGVTVALVEGDAETMTCRRIAIAKDGRIGAPEPCDFDGLLAAIREWASQARLS